jgi:hypothetical protein
VVDACNRFPWAVDRGRWAALERVLAPEVCFDGGNPNWTPGPYTPGALVEKLKAPLVRISLSPSRNSTSSSPGTEGMIDAAVLSGLTHESLAGSPGKSGLPACMPWRH